MNAIPLARESAGTLALLLWLFGDRPGTRRRLQIVSMKETKAMQQLKSIFASACMGILLAACSGGSGGGSGGPVVSTPQEAMKDAKSQDKPEAPTQMTDSTEPVLQEDLRESVRKNLFDLSGAEPLFGSVLVITNPDVMGVESTFEDGSPSVTVNRGEADDIVLDPVSAAMVADDGNEASYVGLPERTGRAWRIYDTTETSATYSLVAVDWANDNPDDYLAGGYWLHADTETVEIGAFIDGPEMDGDNPPTLPIAGTASYRGSSAGGYLALAGTDANYPVGSLEVGEFVGTATLSADFLAGTINGCVGCEDDIYLRGTVFNSATGLSDEFIGLPTDYEVNLGSVPFDRSDGRFDGENVTVTSPSVPITQSSGIWAGQFSNVPNDNGDPRLVGGAFGGLASTAGGTQALFIGAFAAGAQ